uniref:PhoLip_ATPase_C domain-containing protein n=1 Tax=Bursaphelenchus xylophilus TaxID=6326 RepID=A0A1I7SLZ0_BURXY
MAEEISDRNGNPFDVNPRFLSMEEQGWQYLTKAGGFFTFVNLVLYVAIYRYSTHPSPGFACIQLSMPLFIWELLIIIAFCPTEILEYYLGEIIIDLDGNLMDQDLHLQRFLALRQAQPVHSCGDIIPTPNSSQLL